MRHVGQSWRSPRHVRTSLVRRAWLWSGLVLFSYVVSHLVNHALGLISLEVMETGRDWFLTVWRHPVGTVALYSALSAHIVLALSSLYQRRHFRLPAWEALQLLLGLAIPPLLISHIVGTRLGHAWFSLNHYFDVVGSAIEQAGGIANQFTGDGVMALFGVQVGPTEGCRQALAATVAIVRGLSELNLTLVEEMEESLRIGLGIHTGPAVVGRMGRGVALYLPAVGDTVHVASRLQELTKVYGCQLVISDQVAVRAGLDMSAFPCHELTVRNRRDPLVIRTIDDVQALTQIPKSRRAG